eukprot:1157118-Pelagomonas_calceolata.AAC.8
MSTFEVSCSPRKQSKITQQDPSSQKLCADQQPERPGLNDCQCPHGCKEDASICEPTFTALAI